MTVSYAGEVPNASSFGCFWKILWKWRGSVYKLVWRELCAYLFLYYTINLTYRYILNDHQQKVFVKIRSYFGEQFESIPMSFVLGFYVTLVVGRWWAQYRLLPWPDTLALFISAAIPNGGAGVNNETGRLMRRNIMRYMVLAYVITLQRISLRVKRRFPTTQHLVDAGLMHESEMKIFDAFNQKSPMSKYWMPLVWATNIINRARKDGLISSDHIVQTILMELSDIRRRLGGLIGYDTVCVPLVYTQVVTLALYTYFTAALIGRQMLPNMVTRNGREDPDLYFPLFTVLQFVFFVGWLKVAEVLINPFGEDDDDIELNWLIDRHIKAAYMIVDEMHEEHPELLRDQYWECVVPKELPYTVASEHYRRHEPKGSAENYKVKKEDAMYANIVAGSGGVKRMVSDDVYADYESVDTPMVERRKNNWLVRQLSRMGSMRSESTAYSSGGAVFNRNRLNSVYTNPDSNLPMTVIAQQHAMQQQMQQTSKPSLYDKFVHRKSLRNQKQFIKQAGKNALAAQATTPGTFYTQTSNSAQDGHILGTLLLSPIKESDTTSSNNTLIAAQPAAIDIAESTLAKNIKPELFEKAVFKSSPLETVSPNALKMTTSSSAITAMPLVVALPSSYDKTDGINSTTFLTVPQTSFKSNLASDSTEQKISSLKNSTENSLSKDLIDSSSYSKSIKLKNSIEKPDNNNATNIESNKKDNLTPPTENKSSTSSSKHNSESKQEVYV